ncbi:MAG: F0F1 ATP synthase subunit delta [Opitutales bacterium]|nr:F0F1 ATP synthase subunit delta [Opitutales bacterium]
MTFSSKHKRLAKSLLHLSLNEEGHIVESKIEEILSSLRSSNPTGLKSLLRYFYTEVRRHEYTYHAVAEIGCKDDPSITNSIVKRLESNIGKNIKLTVIENPQIISGCRIRLKDDVYEDSLQSRLQKLEKSFH